MKTKVRMAAGAILLAALLGAAGASPGVSRSRVTRHTDSHYEIEAPTPDVLRQKALKDVLDLAVSAYPDANLHTIRKHFTVLLQRESQRFQVSRAGGVTWNLDAQEEIGLSARLPMSWDRDVSVYTFGRPASLPPKAMEANLSLEKAKVVAEAFLARRFPDLRWRESLRCKVSPVTGGDQVQMYYFTWEAAGLHGREDVPQALSALVRVNDGLIQEVRQNHPRSMEPSIPKDVIAKRGREKIKDFDGEHLKLAVEHHFTNSALVWEYVIPPGAYGLPRDRTRWDAATGEELYSEVLGGGTRDRPYRSQGFYFPVTEETLAEGLRKRLEAQADFLRRASRTQPATANAPAKR